MTAYDSVVVGKLKLKGKALDVKAGGIQNKKKKKKKKNDKSCHHLSETNSGFKSVANNQNERMLGGNMLSTGHHEDSINKADKYGNNANDASDDDHLTPAERRFLQQTQKLELQRSAKMASRSHRDRILEFNQYLANLSEHYDIPKVGPG